MNDALAVRVLHAAPGGRRPVVLLHGFLGSSDDWSGIGPEIGRRTDRTVLALDLPGHGASVNLPTPAYTFDGATAAIRDAVYESGGAPVVMVGYSMGGRLAMAATCRAPDLVVALVVESAHPGLDDVQKRTVRLEQDRRTADRLVAEWPEYLSSWYRQPVFEGVPSDVVASWIDRRSDGNPDELARALVGFSPGRQDALTDRLTALDRDLLFVAGGRDRKYVEIGRSLAARGERTTLCSVQDAGHNVHDECSEAYLRALEAFLEPIA
ncbi:MAG: alpha/beta fold hydrolase [Rhodothermales bacterium]|nr:alpha/beta fold hydrolase [Rhodothermales bacterium]